jgi:DNA-binding MarR family transcriptional regulator
MASESPDHVDRVRAKWREVRPDLDTTPVAVVARVGRTAAYFDQAVNELLGEHGLNRGAWDVLASLRREGPPYELSPTDLYRGVMRTSGAMTNRLHRLEAAGLIERHRDPADGRGIMVRLSARGVKLVDELAPLHLANERGLLAGLTPDDIAALEAILRRLLHSFEGEGEEPPG